MSELSTNAKRLYSLMDSACPDFAAIERELKSGSYTPYEITSAFIYYLDYYIWEYSDLLMICDEPTEEDYHMLRTPNALQILEILTAYGADLNAHFDGDSILSILIFIDTPNVAADIASFVLSHGASDMNINDEYPESFIGDVDGEIDFCLKEDEHSFRLTYLFQLYMVALGYGCTYISHEIPAIPIDGFDFSNFREYKKYDYESYIDGKRTLYRFYEKESHKIVAIY